MNRLVVIVGPTAIGKTQLSLRLAQIFGGEVVSADSRQLYRFMDIGTAKPSTEELALVPHHLINVVNPDEDFSLAQYQELAYQAIADIQQRQKVPLLVGGTGMYVWSVLEGWGIPPVPPDKQLRNSLEEKAAGGGGEELYQELATVDPMAVQKIDPRNVRRVIRALEVYKGTGVPFSQLQRKEEPPFDMFIIGLTVGREELYRRIDVRVDEMIGQGLIEEVQKLMDMGYHFDLPAMSAIGYKEISMFLRGGIKADTAIQQMKFETHRFARHQYNWFRLKDNRIKWLNIQRRADWGIIESLGKFITGQS